MHTYDCAKFSPSMWELMSNLNVRALQKQLAQREHISTPTSMQGGREDDKIMGIMLFCLVNDKS